MLGKRRPDGRGAVPCRTHTAPLLTVGRPRPSSVQFSSSDNTNPPHCCLPDRLESSWLCCVGDVHQRRLSFVTNFSGSKCEPLSAHSQPRGLRCALPQSRAHSPRALQRDTQVGWRVRLCAPRCAPECENRTRSRLRDACGVLPETRTVSPAVYERPDPFSDPMSQGCRRSRGKCIKDLALDYT